MSDLSLCVSAVLDFVKIIILKLSGEHSDHIDVVMVVSQACWSLCRLCSFLFLLVLFSWFKQQSMESTSTLLYVVTRLSATPLVEGGRTLRSMFVRPSRRRPCSIPKILKLCKQSGVALCLIYLAGDLELNPGPAARNTCGICRKIIKKNQSFSDCSVCLKSIHLTCFGPDLNFNKSCNLYTCQNHSVNEIDNNLDNNGLFLSQKLSDISAIKGFKIVHQNIRILPGSIDELHLIASDLRLSLQFMSFSETWAHKDIADSELEIPGYQLFLSVVSLWKGRRWLET